MVCHTSRLVPNCHSPDDKRPRFVELRAGVTDSQLSDQILIDVDSDEILLCVIDNDPEVYLKRYV